MLSVEIDRLKGEGKMLKNIPLQDICQVISNPVFETNQSFVSQQCRDMVTWYIFLSDSTSCDIFHIWILFTTLNESS